MIKCLECDYIGDNEEFQHSKGKWCPECEEEHALETVDVAAIRSALTDTRLIVHALRFLMVNLDDDDMMSLDQLVSDTEIDHLENRIKELADKLEGEK